MKKVKFILPLLAFAFAVVAALASGKETLVAPDYYHNIAGICTQIPSLSCNNVNTSLCTYNPGSGYQQVYERIKPSTTQCEIALFHSGNGRLN